MPHAIRVALSVIVATASLTSLAARPPVQRPAPTDSATARYCLRVAPPTGSLVQTVRCWTRAVWIEQGVDIDKEWAREGVAILP